MANPRTPAEGDPRHGVFPPGKRPISLLRVWPTSRPTRELLFMICEEGDPRHVLPSILWDKLLPEMKKILSNFMYMHKYKSMYTGGTDAK